MGKKKMKLATFLIQKGLISVDQAQQIMKEQETMKGPMKERFGRIAVKKGYISECALTRAILAKEREEAGF